MNPGQLLMFWGQIVRYLDLFKDGLDIFTLPEWNDPLATRGWVLDALTFLGRLADLSETTLDDQVVDWVVGLVDDDQVWPGIHTLIVAIFVKEETIDSTSPLVHRIAKDAAISPALVMVIVQLVVQLYTWWKSQ